MDYAEMWATQPTEARVAVLEDLLQQLLTRLNVKGTLSNADLDEIAAGTRTNILDGEARDAQQQLHALNQLQWGFSPQV